MAVFAPLLATHHPNAQALQDRLLPPGAGGHLLGTDELGRDIWSRIVYGARTTLTIVALVALTAPVFGLVVGTAAGYLGGWTDRVLMRITDIFMAFPRLILALAFVAALGPGIENAVLAIALHRLAALCARRAGRDADACAAPTTSPRCACRAPARCASSSATSCRCACPR